MNRSFSVFWQIHFIEKNSTIFLVKTIIYISFVFTKSCKTWRCPSQSLSDIYKASLLNSVVSAVTESSCVQKGHLFSWEHTCFHSACYTSLLTEPTFQGIIRPLIWLMWIQVDKPAWGHRRTNVSLLWCSCKLIVWQLLQPAWQVFIHQALAVATVASCSRWTHLSSKISCKCLKNMTGAKCWLKGLSVEWTLCLYHSFAILLF